MIIKIRRFFEKQEWWIVDEVRKVSIGSYQFANVESVKEIVGKAEHNVVIMDSLSKYPHVESRYVVLTCCNSWGGEFSIMFDTVAYICNDEGKTIEKISVSSEY